MATPGKRATRSTVSEGAAELVAPVPDTERRRQRATTPKRVQTPKTPSPPRKSPGPKTPTRTPRAPKTARTPKTPVAAKTSVKYRQPTPGRGKQKARDHPSDGSDEDFVPDPEPPKKKRSPISDKTYKPTKESLDREDLDDRISPDRPPVNRNRPASLKGSPRPRKPELDEDANSNDSDSEPSYQGENAGSDVQASNNDDDMDLDDSENEDQLADDDKENAALVHQQQNEEEDADMQGDQANQEIDSENPSDAGNNDDSGQSDLDQQEEHSSDVASQSSRSDTSSAATIDNGNQRPISRTSRPNFRQINSDTLRRRVLFKNLKTHHPGYTSAELRSALKRPLQDEGEGETQRTPKKTRFASPTNADGSGPSSYLEEPAKEIFARILNIPEDLNLAEIGACFTQLQDESLEFARRYFDFKLSDEQIEAWPLHLLKWEYLGLKTTAQWLADGSGFSWRAFFSSRQSRIPLIHAIIGEYLKEHVFKHTAFSFTGNSLRRLKELDEEYLRYDAFVRNKKRAALLTEIIHDTHGFWLAHREYMFNASDALAREIMALLEPLMPPPLFDPLVSSRCVLEKQSPFSFRGNNVSEADQRDAKSLWDFMMHDLRVIIYKAASVHLSVRLSGHDGTNIRILRHIEKGTEYHESETIECINKADCDKEQPQELSEDDQMKIKMTCWGQVEAVVPHGVDLEQYEQIEAQFNERNGSQDSRSFDVLETHFEKHLPVLPAELQEGDHEMDEGPRHPGTEWDHQLAREEAQQRKEQNKQRQQTRRHGTPDLEDVNPFHKPQRGSYVTYYKSIVRSQVYCEWGKRGQNPAQQTLDEAVEEARLASGLYYRLEDNFIHTANAAMQLIERSGLPEHWPDVVFWTVGILGTPVMWKLGQRPEVDRFVDAVKHYFEGMGAADGAREALKAAVTTISRSFITAPAASGRSSASGARQAPLIVPASNVTTLLSTR
jgi:hypothetical protein